MFLDVFSPSQVYHIQLAPGALLPVAEDLCEAARAWDLSKLAMASSPGSQQKILQGCTLW
jgi:hypothetical protein